MSVSEEAQGVLNKQTAVSISLMLVIIGAAIWTAVGLHDIPKLQEEVSEVQRELRNNTIAIQRLTVIMETMDGAPSKADLELLRMRLQLLEDKVGELEE